MIDAESIDAKIEFKNFLLGLDHSQLLQDLKGPAKNFLRLCKKLGLTDSHMDFKFMKAGIVDGGIFHIVLEPDFTCSLFNASRVSWLNGVSFFDYLMLICRNSPLSAIWAEVDVRVCFPPEELGIDTPLMKVLRSMGVGEE